MASQPLMIQLTTTPPVEGLYFRSLSGVEEVSRLFEYQVVVITEDSALDLSGLLGKPAAVSVEVAEDHVVRERIAGRAALNALRPLALALPLYLLKIETVPAEAAWLPGLVFIAFIFPSRLLAGWAMARAKRRQTPRHWTFRWIAWLPVLPLPPLPPAPPSPPEPPLPFGPNRPW